MSKIIEYKDLYWTFIALQRVYKYNYKYARVHVPVYNTTIFIANSYTTTHINTTIRMVLSNNTSTTQYYTFISLYKYICTVNLYMKISYPYSGAIYY